MRDNKGYSLVEIVVVVAIITIVGGLLGYTFNMVFNQQARECANNISTSLDKAKNYALTRSGSSSAYMELYKEVDGDYMIRHYEPVNPIDPASGYVMFEEKTVGSKAVKITCYLQNGDIRGITDAQGMRIYYNRVSGAFEKIEMIDASRNVTQTDNCTVIEIKRGAQYNITLTIPTGKHKLERIS